MNINPKKYPKLVRLVDKHEKNLEAFQAQATAFFHPYAVALCRRIQKGIPEFEGCMLAMRELYLEPRNHPVSITHKEDKETGDERLQNIISYLDDDRYTVNLPEDTLAALAELNQLSNYIDGGYSVVGDLSVTLADEPASLPARRPSAVKEHKRLTKMDFNRIAASIGRLTTRNERWKRLYEVLPQLKASNPRFDKRKFLRACNLLA